MRQPGNVPTTLNVCYYAQRASAALIISEAVRPRFINPRNATVGGGAPSKS
jgi:hypothetical protein